jgi:radical SAM protein with 4Fe4S-binding SPASM domain
MLGIPQYGLPWYRPKAIMNYYRAKLTFRRTSPPVRTSCMPISAFIEPTVLCNSNCTYCHSHELREARDKIHMTFEEFVDLLRQIPSLISINLSGMGEPTLNPDFFRMVRHARSCGIAVRTITNCNHHTLAIAEQLVSCGLWYIGTSIDGATAASHERGRRGCDFDRVVGNLRQLVRARGKAKSPVIGVEMLQLVYNYKELPDWVRMCGDIGVDELVVKARIGSWGKAAWAARTVGERALGRTDFEDYLSHAGRLARSYGIRLHALGVLYNSGNRCRRPWGEQVYISTTGDVVPCCAIADPRVARMGNVFEEPLVDIWNKGEYVNLRARINADDLPAYCRGCYDLNGGATDLQAVARDAEPETTSGA